MIFGLIPYLYLNARIMAKEARLVGPGKLEELISAPSVIEIVSALEETEYGEYLSDLAAESVEAVEEALLLQNAEIDEEIFKIIPKKVSALFLFLKEKWDIHNLKVIFRGIDGGLSGEEINARLIPAGEFDEITLKDLASCRSMEDFIAQLEETSYRDLASELVAYEKSKNLFYIEAKLDQIFLDSLWQKISNGIKKKLPLLIDYFTLKMDCINLKILLRAKRDALDLKEVEKYFVEGGSILPKLKEGFDGADLNDLITMLEETDYFQPLMETLPQYEKEGSLFPLEAVLDRLKVRKGRDMALKQPWAIGPLLGFLTSREEEMKKIKIIIKSKEMGLETEEIRNLLLEL